jgi:hypothetical protein
MTTSPPMTSITRLIVRLSTADAVPRKNSAIANITVCSTNRSLRSFASFPALVAAAA